jgi:hypothetical protein
MLLSSELSSMVRDKQEECSVTGWKEVDRQWMNVRGRGYPKKLLDMQLSMLTAFKMAGN